MSIKHQTLLDAEGSHVLGCIFGQDDELCDGRLLFLLCLLE